MFNLLPEKTKEVVRREYQFRTWATFFVLLSTVFFFLILIFLPALFVSNSIRLGLEHNIEDLNKSVVLVDYKTMAFELNESNTQIITAKENLKNRIDLQELIEVIDGVRPSSIKINRFAFKDAGGQTNLILSGEADDRDALKNFSAKLQGVSKFSSVEVPLSSFTKSSNADFSITLEVVKNSPK